MINIWFFHFDVIWFPTFSIPFQALLEGNATVEWQDIFGATPLHLAAAEVKLGPSLEADQFGVGRKSIQKHQSHQVVSAMPNFHMNHDDLLSLLMDVDVATFHHPVLFCQGRASTVEALLASRTTQADFCHRAIWRLWQPYLDLFGLQIVYVSMSSYTVDVLKTYQWRRDDMFPQWYICVSAPLKDQYKCHPHNPATGRCVGRGRKNRKLLRKWSMILGQEMSFLLKQDCCTRWLHMFVRFVELYQLVTCLQPAAP